MTFPCSDFSTHPFVVQAMRPEAHKDLSQQVDRILSGSNARISEFMGDVNAILRKQGIEVEDIEGRPKSIGSIRAKQAPCRLGTPSKVCLLLHLYMPPERLCRIQRTLSHTMCHHEGLVAWALACCYADCFCCVPYSRALKKVACAAFGEHT